MDLRQSRYQETPLVKSKIVATVGPACASRERLKQLVRAGADLFRLNFAHGTHEWLEDVVASIRAVSAELNRPIGILGDLSGPKIRLGELPDEGLRCETGAVFEFVRNPQPGHPAQLTSTYDRLIDDVGVDDRVLLADGTVALRVVEKPAGGERIVCVVEQSGIIRGRQGINLPGVSLSTPCLTEKDHQDLEWAVRNGLDFVGLSFVRRSDDVGALRAAITDLRPECPPHIVAKIEKTEAISQLDEILDATDAVMIARGDLGVEVDIARVPILQKRIIRLCNLHRIPVITATQMLDSMQSNERPTRAESTDVANAVLDGSDALMLSGETAIGQHPVESVAMMSRIAQEAERLVPARHGAEPDVRHHSRATPMTDAVTLGAVTAAEELGAELIVVATQSGKTALAVSKQRSLVPVLALTDRPHAARRMCLYWGVTPFESPAVAQPPQAQLTSVAEWSRRQQILTSGSRFVLVGTTDWSKDSKNLMLVHSIP